MTGWLAYDRIEPISAEWAHTATTAAAAHNAGVLIAAAHGVDLEPVTPDQFIPDREAQPETPPERMTADEIQQALARRFGI